MALTAMLLLMTLILLAENLSESCKIDETEEEDDSSCSLTEIREALEFLLFSVLMMFESKVSEV